MGFDAFYKEICKSDFYQMIMREVYKYYQSSLSARGFVCLLAADASLGSSSLSLDFAVASSSPFVRLLSPACVSNSADTLRVLALGSSFALFTALS